MSVISLQETTARLMNKQVILNEGYILRFNEQHYDFVVEMVRKPQIYLSQKTHFNSVKYLRIC